MTDPNATPFEKQYQAALRLCLSSGADSKTSFESAHSLGHQASESRMSSLDLVRTHHQALVAISATTTQRPKRSPEEPTPAEDFLLASLSTLEQNTAKTLEVAQSNLLDNERRHADEIAHYKQLLDDSRCLEEQSRLLARNLLLAQEEERKEISRELHDEVAQILAGINVRLASLREEGVINFASFEESIQQTQKMIEKSVDVVHRFARKLRPAILDDFGLIPALRSLLEELERPTDLIIKFEELPVAEDLDKTQCTVIYRVAHEALMNVLRHAQAHRVAMRLLAIPGGIRLQVQDDGKAFDVDKIFLSNAPQRLGLLGMKERVEMVGGVLSIQSEKGKGTTINADIPFNPRFPEESP